ncbi:hypothetical protein ACRAWF_24780 [Streptomyces sp. L7]
MPSIEILLDQLVSFDELVGFGLFLGGGLRGVVHVDLPRVERGTGSRGH